MKRMLRCAVIACMLLPVIALAAQETQPAAPPVEEPAAPPAEPAQEEAASAVDPFAPAAEPAPEATPPVEEPLPLEIAPVLEPAPVVVEPAPAVAEQAPPVETALPAPTTGPHDPKEIEAFLDGVMNSHLEAYHTAGATVAIVRDGEVIFQKGYGYADYEARKKVDPDTTLFRIGSVSKLFTWTAVMQLVEQGKLDLDADVNTYLKDFQIPMDVYTEPITLKDILTHTPGFEDRVLHLFVKDETGLKPLGELLKNDLPNRVRPAGDIASYSNHATALAGYIVELVSGMPWADYVETNIIKPLGLEHTSIRQPLPKELTGDLSKGYIWEGEFKEQTFEYIPLAPAGSTSSSAGDMAKFLIAHMQLGKLGDARILKEETARLMQSDLHHQVEGMDPMAHGFIVSTVNGQRLVGHGGDTLWFHTMFHFLPEHNVGYFVSYNTREGGEASGQFCLAFMDHYYPAPDPEVLVPADGAANTLAKFAGSYRLNRYDHSSFMKLGAALQPMSISVTDKGELLINMAPDKRWIQTGPLMFREKHGPETFAFREDESGNITNAFMNMPIMAFDRLAWYEGPSIQLIIAVPAVLLCLLTLVAWVHSGISRRFLGVTFQEGARLPGFSRYVLRLSALLWIAFLVAMIVSMSPDPSNIVFGVPKMLDIAFWFPVVAAPIGAIAVICALVAWVRHQGKVVPRIAYTITALAMLAVTWQAYYWHLLDKVNALLQQG